MPSLDSLQPDSGVAMLHLRDVVPTDRGGGVRTWKLVTARRGARAFLTGITEFEPGASLPMHFHNCQESVLVLAGEAGFEVGERVHPLEPGSATLIEAGVPHRFINLGADSLRILWI